MITVDDQVMTPDGLGVAVVFECHPPLSTRAPSFLSREYPENHQEGWFIRVGVKNVRPDMQIAYYPLRQVKPIG